MPELVQQFTAPTSPPFPLVGTPPSDAPPAATVPPVIVPEAFEEYPAFRETFLLFFTDPVANTTLRAFGRLLHELVLEFWGQWPDHPEGIFRTSLRAAIADLRHIQGSLQEWTGPDIALNGRQDEHLAGVAADVARDLGKLGDRLEKNLSS